MFSCLSILDKSVLIVALAAGLLTQFFPCCAFAIRSFSKVSATPDYSNTDNMVGLSRMSLSTEFLCCGELKASVKWESIIINISTCRNLSPCDLLRELSLRIESSRNQYFCCCKEGIFCNAHTLISRVPDQNGVCQA